jgi:sulfite reductase (ferredoxin)
MPERDVPDATQEEGIQSQPPPSKVEGIKENSQALRGSIAQGLGESSDHFSEQDKQLLKFHGTYQQEDRDARKLRRNEGLGKPYIFMVRCKIPGGRVTADQYLALDELCETHGNGTLRVTSRQGFQFHGVIKAKLKETIAAINHTLLTTLGACGDVNRNVMACPAPLHDALHEPLQEVARELAAHFAPRTGAYHEIWINDERVNPNGTRESEPIYGKVYLPRKFKIGLALAEDNCVDLYGQDLGLLAIVEQGKVVGFNVLVGGGMGMTHGKEETFPHLARPICYVPADEVVGAAEAVVKLFRDHGNRSNRRRARIKYLVHDWGVEGFQDVLRGYLGGKLTQPRPLAATGYDLHLGWRAQGDGRFFYGLSIENGRIKDEGDFRLRSAVRTIVERLRPEVRLTPMQDVLFCNLEAGARSQIKQVLEEHGVPASEQISLLQQHSMSCPAIPTCALAISESERALPGILDDLEVALRELGLTQEAIGVRMTGCPNGCARPYQSDIGIVGRSGDKYLLYVGGRNLGDRLNFPLKDLVPRAEIVPTLLPLLRWFKKDRQPGEGFGEFCTRMGQDALLSQLSDERVIG